MKKHTSLLLVILFTISVKPLFATVDYLVVNHMTSQLYWAETGGGEEGWIGWHNIPEGKMLEEEKKYLEQGYQLTTYPYKIETYIAILLVVTIAVFVTLRRLTRPYTKDS